MRKLLALLTAAAVSIAVTGTATAQSSTGTVTVVHGVPGLPVDVYVNGEPTLTGFEPGTVTDPIELPAGSYELAVRAAGEPADAAPAISGSADLPAGANASIVAHLDPSGARRSRSS
jgi:ABC-type glycerol-3-phosphate transport system substrate-binding protein